MNLECALQQAHLYYQSKNIQSARKVYRQILRHDPMCAQAWNRLGIIAYELGRPEIGVELIKQALDINPNQPEFLVNFGQMLMKLDRFSEAVEAFRGALSTDLDDLDTISNLGICLMKEHRVDEAIQAYQDSLKNNPGSAQIYENLGRVFEEIGLLENSIQAYQCATRLDPEIGTAYAGLARVLYAKGSLEESIKNYRYALKYVPEDALTYNNLGGAYKENGQFDKAVQAYQKAISINPENAKVQNNLGNTFRECGRFDEAIQAYQKAIDTNSQYADSYTNLGTLLLMHGNFECGWKKHEWRWKSDKFVKDNKRFFPHSLWVGCQLTGKSVVIWSEQGVGDQIMYASLLPKFQQQAHRILVETQQRLVPLFRRSFPGISFFRIQDPPNSKLLEESIDYQLPIGSLARWLLPDEESFPKKAVYLKACVNKVKELRDKYQQLESDKLLIGISWKSVNKDIGKLKSTFLTQWGDLLSQKDCLFINLQYGDVEEEINAFTAQTGISIYQDRDIDSLKDLDGFAAQVSALDLIISTSNTTVHMAGALGRRVWTLLHYVPDWRWQLDRLDTPWYPSMTLYRQPVSDDWYSVFQRVQADLQWFVTQNLDTKNIYDA